MSDIFNKLLGDGRSSLGPAAGKGGKSTFEGSQPVHAVMTVKTLIFNGDQCVDQIGRDIFISDPNPVFIAAEGLILQKSTCIRVSIINGAGKVHGIFSQVSVGLGHDHIFDVDRRKTG